MSFLGMGVRIFREIWAKQTFLPTFELRSKRRKLACTIFGPVFEKGQSMLYYGVSHYRGVARDESGDIGP